VSALAVAALVLACTFGGSLLGIRSRLALPARHLNQESKELVQLCMGLIATMTALILGLVTASAKAAFDAEDAAVHTSAEDVLMLDRILASYGPETKPLRADMREAIQRNIVATWQDDRTPAQSLPSSAGEPVGQVVLKGILALTPQTDAQRWQQSQALSLASDVLKARWLAITGTSSPVPTPFLTIIVFWLTVLFWSFGLFAPRNPTVVAVLLLSAVSISACVLLILEMQSPFTGILRISSAPLHFALEHLGS
jgi:hypothetical protein